MRLCLCVDAASVSRLRRPSYNRLHRTLNQLPSDPASSPWRCPQRPHHHPPSLLPCSRRVSGATCQETPYERACHDEPIVNSPDLRHPRCWPHVSIHASRAAPRRPPCPRRTHATPPARPRQSTPPLQRGISSPTSRIPNRFRHPAHVSHKMSAWRGVAWHRWVCARLSYSRVIVEMFGVYGPVERLSEQSERLVSDPG